MGKSEKPTEEYKFVQVVEALGSESAMLYNVRVPPTPEAIAAAGVFKGSVRGSIDDRPVFDDDLRRTICVKCGMLVLLNNCSFPSGACKTCGGAKWKPDPVAMPQPTPKSAKKNPIIMMPSGTMKPVELDITSFKDTETKYVTGIKASVDGPVKVLDENGKDEFFDDDAEYTFSPNIYAGKGAKPWSSTPIAKPKPQPKEPEFTKPDRKKRPILFDE